MSPQQRKVFARIGRRWMSTPILQEREGRREPPPARQAELRDQAWADLSLDELRVVHEVFSPRKDTYRGKQFVERAEAELARRGETL